MIRRLLSFGIKAETLMFTHALAVLVGMSVEGALVVSVMAGHAVGRAMLQAVGI